MSDEKVNYLSLAELENDQDELVGFRPNVDANEFVPPLVHGYYNTLIVFDSTNPAERWVPDITTKGEPKKYNKTVLSLTTDQNQNDDTNGREFSYYCSTLVRRGGTTGVQAVLQGIGVDQAEIAANSTRGGQCMLLNRMLENNDAYADAEIDWEASYFDADYIDPETQEKVGREYFRLRGMERFPEAVDGQAEYDRSILLTPEVAAELNLKAAGGKRYYPWVDLDVTDLDNPVVVLPTETAAPGRNIHRAYVRNFVRRFRTKTVITKSSTAAASAGPQRTAPSAPTAAAPATARHPAASRPAPVRR